MKTLIVLGGPTAAGKTALAIKIAQQLDCDIISADSRQFYRELNIGTAKPSSKELSAIQHHFIDSISIHDTYDVNRFESETLNFLEKYFAKKNIIIITGGSGLYLDAILKGLDPLPEKNELIRKELEHEWRNYGIEHLQKKIRELDPITASTIDLMNPSRLIRAIEICILSGQPASSFRTGKAANRPFESILVAITPERNKLYERINSRVDQMMEAGLLKEVEQLLAHRNLPALQTVGYTELFEYLDGKHTLETAIDLIKQHTRNYAKRQLTWFRNRNEYKWFDPAETTEIFEYIKSGLVK